jgi:hypothetical protein
MNGRNRDFLATFSEDVITVYQAYPPAIADAAIEAGTLVAPFRLGRTTWIKPSFFWMMYRSDWGRRSGQERILAVDIRRPALEWVLGRSCLSAYEPELHGSLQEWRLEVSRADAVVQWDPDRDAELTKLPRRTIQIGLRPQVVPLYTGEWIARLTDVTPLAARIFATVGQGDLLRARELAPRESPYPLPPAVARRIGLHPAISRSE